MRPIVNPGMPTPLGMAYYLPNPTTGKATEFDDCQQEDAVRPRHPTVSHRRLLGSGGAAGPGGGRPSGALVFL